MPIDFPSNPTLNQIYSSNTKSWIYGSYGWKAYDAVGTVANTSVTRITATSGQTLFTVPTYVQGQNQIRVFIDGVRQNNVVDFAETSSTTITLVDPATVGVNVAFEVSTYAGTPVQIGFPSTVNDITSNTVKYPVFTSITGGGLSVVNTDTQGLSYLPITGTLTANNMDVTSTLTANNINIGSTNPVDVLDYIITYNLAFG
jgi:hypothetical protein